MVSPENYAKQINTSMDSYHVVRKQPGENDYVIIPRSYRAVLPSLMFFVLMCILTIRISNEFPETIYQGQVQFFGITFYVFMPLMGLFLALSLVRPIFFMYDAFFQARSHHIVAVTGILSLRKREIAIPYEDLRGVEVAQSLLQRVLLIGDIVLGTAMTDKPEIVMKGIGHPQHYASIISERLDEVRMNNPLAKPPL